MKVTTYEATVRDGSIVLPEDANIPNDTRVYVVVPAVDDVERVRVMSPRLAHREDAADFTMKVVFEDEDARI
jgi:hypothetical protein